MSLSNLIKDRLHRVGSLYHVYRDIGCKIFAFRRKISDYSALTPFGENDKPPIFAVFSKKRQWVE